MKLLEKVRTGLMNLVLGLQLRAMGLRRLPQYNFERTKQFTNNSKWAQQALERPRKRVK